MKEQIKDLINLNRLDTDIKIRIVTGTHNKWYKDFLNKDFSVIEAIPNNSLSKKEASKLWQIPTVKDDYDKDEKITLLFYIEKSDTLIIKK